MDHRERAQVAQRTMELLEARRLAEIAHAGDGTEGRKKKKKNNNNKRCEVDFTRQRLDEEFAAQERGPRYVNNTAVFLKKGQKEVDPRALAHLGVKKADGSVNMTET